MEDGKVLSLDKNNFLGSAIFNGNKIYRKILIDNGNIILEKVIKKEGKLPLVV